MKKKLLISALVMSMICMLVGCSSGGGSSAQPSSSAPAPSSSAAAPAGSDTPAEPGVDAKTFKVNLTVGASDPQYAWWQDFFGRIEQAAEGTVKFELYTEQSLGTNDEITEAIAGGAEFIGIPDYAGLVDYNPDASIFHVPYLIQEPGQIYELWQSDIGKNIDSKLDDNGVHVFSVIYFGTRNVISKPEIKEPADFGSVKLRVGTSKMWNFTAECLGANATNTAWSEVYQALTQGVADACESPSTLLYSNKIFEVCKNLVKTEHLVCNSAVIMSSQVFNSLPEAAQKAFTTVGQEFARETVQLTSDIAGEYDQKLRDEGVTIVEIDKTPFIEYSANNVEAAFPEWTEGLYRQAHDFLYN